MAKQRKKIPSPKTAKDGGGNRIPTPSVPPSAKNDGLMQADQAQFCRERLALPAYRVGEAARYARTTPATVASWERIRGNRPGVVTHRERRAALSYFQLIEVGVVAAMRKAGLKMSKIREAREYLADQFDSQHPFAEYRFKTDGKGLFLGYEQLRKPSDRDKLLSLNESGQLAWTEVLSQRLQEFEYDADRGQVLSWRVAGVNSPVLIDPRVSFGAPQVQGIATWVLRERWNSGENIHDIGADYDIEPRLVQAALRFEGVIIDLDRPARWVH